MKALRTDIIVAAVACLLAILSPFYPCSGFALGMDKSQKLFAVNAGGVLFITGWGIANWDYGQETPRASREGWFGQETNTGGADKLGHFYTTYVLSHGMTHLCDTWGYSETQAPLYGSLSAFGLMGFMEFGDAFSSYGFSHEDFIMNTAGASLGYLTKRYPKISEKLDFRLEYTPSFDEPDLLTDYENMKFLTALKFDGFRVLQTGIWQYLELHVGYYTRGYDDDDSDPRRYLYGGLGVNLSRIFRQNDFPKTSTTLRYLQIPNTDIQVRSSPL
ncbi:hypothetical protein DSLASN_26550 [Desulfoluna limicola]|uniref:DUF2279 domain-containing protein n=1 Tax=Desulfoluna limicola TaxID=2810562 RepID=A0ABM7PIF4_9BACT|nr:DUF2279 domain-containing protein [Desulfoluna limicola]BCS97023.1 hypothetical protein DSLASN_26550 [Desulfoluna limicola]